MEAKNNLFPPDFLWGAATSAYQIEGHPDADGKGENIWDRFCTVPGAIKRGETGVIACDHYKRWPEDVALMKEMGLNSYRFSLSWARILPAGRGKVNQAGLDFYDRLVDALLKEGITPYVTLYHWDLPQALQDEGGWANRNTTDAFAEFAEVASRRLGDRVTDWITHNEPQVAAFIGHLVGRHAPGIKDLPMAFQVSHNLLLSHGKAVPVLRASNPKAKVGITLNLYPVYPGEDSDSARAAVQRADGALNRWFLDPLFKGAYPQDTLELLGKDAPHIEPGDLEIIKAPLDFLGVNYYFRNVVVEGSGEESRMPFLRTKNLRIDNAEYTTMNWEVYPAGLDDLLQRLHRDYKVPAYYITENGSAFNDVLPPEAVIRDDRRQSYLEEHFAAASRSIAAGVPLKGYFVWSLLDNFEWGHGYDQRFGIIYVDFPTGRRIWKDSARWYQNFIKAQF